MASGRPNRPCLENYSPQRQLHEDRKLGLYVHSGVQPRPPPAGDGVWDVGILNKVLLCVAEQSARGPSQVPAGGAVVPFLR